MKQEKMSREPNPVKPILDSAPKKTYQRPVLRTFGSLHRMTQGSAGKASDGAGFKRPAGSDRSIKENIVRIGDHPLGIGLYLFDYKPGFGGASGNGRQFGVMADEVEAVLPEAVSSHPDGHKMVNYAMLGIDNPAQ